MTAIPSVIEIWDDLHEERDGFVRAFWVSHYGRVGSPVIDYCSPGGSHRTIQECVSELRRLGYVNSIYRNGRCVAQAVVPSPLFSKRHYEWLAAFYKQHLLRHDVEGRIVLRELAGALERDNPRFDRNRFLKACGEGDFNG